jgi:hypothetical protein
MQSPDPVNQQANAGQFPPEVYQLAAAYQMGVPLEEHVYPTDVTSCLIYAVVGLLCIGCLLAGVYGLTGFVVSSHLLPTPFVKSAVFGWLVLALIGLAVIAGGIIPSYILRGSILRRKEEERRNRFRGTQLVYACSNGMLWLDRGKVSAAYPWQTIEGVRRVVSRSRGRGGGTRPSWWLYFTDGSQEQIDPSIFGMIEAGLQRYRLSHGLPATQVYGPPGGKRRVRPQYTMHGRGRWTWSKAGCVLLLILFLLCGGLASDPQLRAMLVNGLFSLFHWLAHP